VPSIDEALLLLELEPVHAEIRERLALALGRARRDSGRLAAAVATLDGEPFDERRLWPVVTAVLRDAGYEAADAERCTGIVRALVVADPELRRLDDATVAAWFDDPTLSAVLLVHEADGVRWFDRDAFESLVETVATLGPAAGPGAAVEAAAARPAELSTRAAAAGYRVDELRAALRRSGSRTRTRRPGGSPKTPRVLGTSGSRKGPGS
jgi:hypothetical protein